MSDVFIVGLMIEGLSLSSSSLLILLCFLQSHGLLSWCPDLAAAALVDQRCSGLRPLCLH
jgi:hypothetical protein